MITVNTDVDIYVSDIIDEIPTEDLIDELETRGFIILDEEDKVSNDNKAFVKIRSFFNKDELYRHLCDICDCGYHEPKDLLLSKIKDLL
jgi:hypothetical protein